MSEPVRPVLLEAPQANQKWVNADGTATHYGQRWHHSVFLRLGAYNDDVWRAMGVGFTGLTQVNMVGQRVSDVEAAIAGVQGSIAGLRGDDRLDAAVKALELATVALVQVQARASGTTDHRLNNLDRLVASLGARLTKATQNAGMQIADLQRDATHAQVMQTGTLQRIGAQAHGLQEEIDAIEDDFESQARASISGTSPVDYNSTTGVIALNANLTSLGGVTTAANKGYYTTALNTWASADLTSFGRSVWALADAAAGRTLFGLVIGTDVLPVNNPTCTGAFVQSTVAANNTMAGNFDLANRFRISNRTTAFTTGAGLELNYNAAIATGSVFAFDRDAGVYRALVIGGSDIQLQPAGTTRLTVSTTAANLAAIPLQYSGTQVVSARRTGWGAPTGTATRTTFATSTVTLPELAERVKALVDDLTTHGLIGT